MAMTAEPRERLLDDVASHFRRTAWQTGQAALEDRVRRAMQRVPRQAFVPVDEAYRAHADSALPIGHHQTISQPFIVALMTQLLATEPGHVVLEVGTGSGYQAAILSELVRRVYSVEIVEPLARDARDRLRRLGYTNVDVKCGDGYYGWIEHAPYDGIIVTAAAPRISGPLLDQLASGGRLVIPKGPHHGRQHIVVVEKDQSGAVRQERVLPVAFVPLTGVHD